jgi:pyrroloquinoline quinone (PQQ) biosynthesis protein C
MQFEKTDRPLLKSSAKISQLADRLVIQYLHDEITLEGQTAALFGKMLPHLDGTRPVQSIAEQVSEQLGTVQSLTDRLNRAGVLALLATGDREAPGMSGIHFYGLHRKYSEYWLRPIYEHPLWELIVSGRASRDQVLGFAFEKYHYIEGAYEHMAIAAANASPEMMPHLARHFIEEYTHGDIYRKGLRSLFRDTVVLEAPPLPSTRALVNFLSETAQRSSFAYYAGNELLQMTENTADPTAGESVDSFYDAMQRHYPETRGLVASFIAHTQADQKLGHESVFKEMCLSVPPLSAGEVKDALNTVRSMAEHLTLFMDGIQACYGQLSTAPRQPADLLSG